MRDGCLTSAPCLLMILLRVDRVLLQGGDEHLTAAATIITDLPITIYSSVLQVKYLFLDLFLCFF